MSNALVPELDNLAWAPIAAVEGLEIFDRYNGVPTLGVIRVGGESHLFWRVLGYTGDVSLWLYVPLSETDESQLEDDEGAGLLDGIVFRSALDRYATVGIADQNRLVFEREWVLPSDLRQGAIVGPLVRFVNEALTIALTEDLPFTRRQVFQKAQAAVKQLVPC